MRKRITSLFMLLCLVLIGFTQAVDVVSAADKVFNLGGYMGATDYTVAAKKTDASQAILFICKLSSPSSKPTTNKALPQNSATMKGTYSADPKALTYAFTSGISDRLKNGIAKGRWARVRVTSKPTGNSYFTPYTSTYYHY